MSEKLFLAHKGTPQNFDFDPHGSGRYREGSGENPHQHKFDFLFEIQKMKDSGLYKNETEIARALGYSTGEYRAKKTNLIAEKYASDAHRALKMKERQMSNSAIAEKLGVSEGTVRNMLKNPEKMKDQILESTTNILRDSLKEKKYIDVGEGVERSLGIPRTKFDAALQKLKEEGYVVKNLQVQQINAQVGQKTSLLVLAPEGTETKEIYQNLGDVKLLNDYHSDDLGLTYNKLRKPETLDSSRIQISYADSNGFQPKDGVIELRPGVDDISLGKSMYAQVRINVDDKYYMKGMAIYSDDLPKGVDVRFNSSKEEGTPIDKVLKPLKRTGYLENGDPDPNSPVDWQNPFGATIKAGGQVYYTDKKGEKHLSVINKVNEEGDWGEWDRTLASQFLSKQSYDLAKKQLNITYLNKQAEFNDIMNISNSEIRKKMLLSFADDCDGSAVDLKAAALPRQATQVLLPLNSIKENEIYAPNFKNGEHVCLVRYPHSGPSEIPDLIVNNNHKEAISIFGKTPKDCVVINPKVASRLAGADFDGDSVVVIPNKRGKTITTKDTLDGLKNFDPHIEYKGYEGMKVMPESIKGTEMGKIANLITDMTLIGCKDEELARAIKHSMVVIDAPKHKLDWKRSEKENGITDLKKKYQGGANAGAGTLISRAKSQEHVPQRRLYVKIDPETGEKIYDPTGDTYTKVWTLKDGTVRTKEIVRTTKSTKMAETSDAFTLASDPNNPYPMEVFYGVYANKMKEMGNAARREYQKIKTYEVSKSARDVYSNEIESITAKTNTALANAPYERQAQMAANVILKQKKIANPNMTDTEKKKIGQQALNDARSRLIPGGKKQRVVLTEKELEAINANAIPASQLKVVLNNADQDKLKEMVMPKQQRGGLSSSKIASAKAMLASGYYTQAEIAEQFGISPTTLMKYINEE